MKMKRLVFGLVAAAFCVGVAFMPSAIASCKGTISGLKTGLMTLVEEEMEPGVTVENPDLGTSLGRVGDGGFCE